MTPQEIKEKKAAEASFCPWCAEKDTWDLLDCFEHTETPGYYTLYLKCKKCGYEWSEAWFY